LLTDRVTDVPTANEADRVEPTLTEMPAGVEVMRSPERPVAVTVSVAADGGDPGGVTVSAAVRVTPAYPAVIVTVLEAETAAVVTANVALVLPAGTVTLAGRPASPTGVTPRETAAPPVGAAADSVTVPWTEPPPATVVGVTTSDASVGAGATARGVKRRTEDQGPSTPAALTDRTRQKC
jgi:hypothetical protein